MNAIVVGVDGSSAAMAAVRRQLLYHATTPVFVI